MHVEFYEKIWMWAAAGLLVLFVGIMLLTAAAVKAFIVQEFRDAETV